MRYWILLFFVFLFAGVKSQKFNQDLNNIQVTWQLINNFYVDSVNPSELANETIKAMLAQLDPHSVYLPANEVKAANEALKGDFEGVGIEFMIMKDTLLVLSVIEGGPSQKAGIRSGDRILTINGKNIASVGIENAEIIAMLRGEKGTTIELMVARRGEDEKMNFTVVCDKIPIHSIEASYMADSTTGYIKISRFSSNTSKEFQKTLKSLIKSGMKELILDLRGNSGGYMSAALSVLDHFLTKGQLMVYTQGATLSRHDHLATSKGLWHKGGLVILIDEHSASASEIVAGAIQDWDRGAIVGRRSYGKGLVQRPYSLTDGAEVRLTIAKYYTPSGRSIQKDYTNGKKAYQREILSRMDSGELMNKDSIHILKQWKHSTLVNGRTVYGGGGIVPDLFVALDTADYPVLYRELIVKGVINNVSLDYFNLNRNQLINRFETFEQYNQEFCVDQLTIENLYSDACELNVSFTDKEIEKVLPHVKIQIKALIARSIWGKSEFYRVINPTMEVYSKALQILNSNEDLAQLLQD